MPTVPDPSRSPEVRIPDGLRLKPAKATLRQSEPVRSSDLSRTIEDALLRHFGSVKAVAYALGEIDPSQLNRDYETGKLTLARLECLDEIAKAKVGAAICEQFGTLTSPKDHARRALREARQQLDQLEQYVEAS